MGARGPSRPARNAQKSPTLARCDDLRPKQDDFQRVSPYSFWPTRESASKFSIFVDRGRVKFFATFIGKSLRIIFACVLKPRKHRNFCAYPRNSNHLRRIRKHPLKVPETRRMPRRELAIFAHPRVGIMGIIPFSV